MAEECLFTRLVRGRKDDLNKILESGSDIVEKVVYSDFGLSLSEVTKDE